MQSQTLKTWQNNLILSVCMAILFWGLLTGCIPRTVTRAEYVRPVIPAVPEQPRYYPVQFFIVSAPTVT